MPTPVIPADPVLGLSFRVSRGSLDQGRDVVNHVDADYRNQVKAGVCANPRPSLLVAKGAHLHRVAGEAPGRVTSKALLSRGRRSRR